MTSLTDRASAFSQLHEQGTFVMPNPWDVGSARYLASLGFQALATTSAGFAWTMGRADGRVTLDEALAHLRAVAGAVDVPVNADFEGGFAVAPEDVGRNVALAADTGVAGLSIEDSTGDVDDPLFEFELAVDRVRAARAAIDASGTGIVLTGRSEGFIAGRPDLDETIRRLRAYADAGADCLYAPGISTREQITAVVQAIAPKPVNVLVWGGFLSVAELAELGVRRISTGSRLAASAWGAAIRAANEIAEHGTFDGLKEAPASAEIVRGFTGD